MSSRRVAGRSPAFRSSPTHPTRVSNSIFCALRPVSGGYTVVGKSGLVTLLGTAVETFSANAPVHAGDVIGFWEGGGLSNCIRSGSDSVDVGVPPSDPNVNDMLTTSFSLGGLALNESANLAPPLPTSKDQCKNGGWQNYGTTFKNQGDCVSFIATGGKNKPSG